MRAILTFHSIDSIDPIISYPQDQLPRLLDGLKAAGLPILELDKLLRPDTRRGVALTFDDGYQSVFTSALPVLRDYGAPAHLFLSTGLLGDGPSSRRREFSGLPMLDWDEVEALHAAGVRIEAHTDSHPDLRDLADAAVIAECEAADRAISARLGRHPRFFAYPYGATNARVQAIAGRRYEAALTTELRPLRRSEDPAAIPRLDSYYLQSGWIQRGLDSGPARAYFAFRRLLRQIRHRRG